MDRWEQGRGWKMDRWEQGRGWKMDRWEQGRGWKMDRWESCPKQGEVVMADVAEKKLSAVMAKMAGKKTAKKSVGLVDIPDKNKTRFCSL